MRSWLSPFFVTRLLLRKAISEAVRSASPNGSLIDIGCGQKPHRDLFSGVETYHGIDFVTYSKNKDYSTGGPDFEFGADYKTNWRLPFGDCSYDHAAAFEVLEHHPETRFALQEMARVVKPGGYVFLSWPFLFALHEEPHDYYRITHHAMERLAVDVGLKRVGVWKTGGLLPSLVTLVNTEVAFLYERGGVAKLGALLCYPALLLAQYLVLPFSKLGSRSVLSYVALFRKNSNE